MEETLGQKRVEDVSWLCSLSESELDMLISIKSIVLQRARMIGCDELAQKFDLKVIRALAFVLMENVKDKVKNLSPPEFAAFMGSCNLLKHNLGNVMSLEEIMACIGIDSRKGPIKRLVQTTMVNVISFFGNNMMLVTCTCNMCICVYCMQMTKSICERTWTDGHVYVGESG